LGGKEPRRRTAFPLTTKSPLTGNPFNGPDAGVDITVRNLYICGMDVHLSPERQAQLNDYAHRRGQDPAAALDDVLAEALEWERQDYGEAVEGIRKGYADFQAGRVRPVDESFEALRVKHGLPR
jgi:predicted transcriptional regulator